MAAFFGAMPSSVTVPFTSPAVDGVDLLAGRRAPRAADGSLEVLEVPLSAAAGDDRDGERHRSQRPRPRAALARTFRKCIDIS